MSDLKGSRCEFPVNDSSSWVYQDDRAKLEE